MTPLPTLRQLQFFVALVRRQSFSKAADDCLVSQSTLSSAIKEMEALIGEALIDRTTRGFALTPAGEAVAARVGGVLASAEDLVHAANNRAPLDGEFRLGVIPTIAPFILPRASKALGEAYPNLRLYLREDLTAALVDRLEGGADDAALIALPYDMPGAEHVEIGEDPFWFVCAKDHPLSSKKTIQLDDLSPGEVLLLEDGHCLREHAIDACNLSDRGASGAFRGTSLLTLTQMTGAGLGVTLIPDMAVKAGLASADDLAARPFSKPAPNRKIGVAWRKGSSRREEAIALADILRELL